MWQTWNSCITYYLRSMCGRGLYSTLFIRDMALHSGLVHHQGLLKTVKFFLCRHLCKVTCDLTICSHPIFWWSSRWLLRASLWLIHMSQYALVSTLNALLKRVLPYFEAGSVTDLIRAVTLSSIYSKCVNLLCRLSCSVVLRKSRHSEVSSTVLNGCA